jgi:hypothetical protein
MVLSSPRSGVYFLSTNTTPENMPVNATVCVYRIGVRNRPGNFSGILIQQL